MDGFAIGYSSGPADPIPVRDALTAFGQTSGPLRSTQEIEPDIRRRVIAVTESPFVPSRTPLFDESRTVAVDVGGPAILVPLSDRAVCIVVEGGAACYNQTSGGLAFTLAHDPDGSYRVFGIATRDVAELRLLTPNARQKIDVSHSAFSINIGAGVTSSFEAVLRDGSVVNVPLIS